jgi:hypothetical protein
MPIPYADDAVVPVDKVTRYLLDESHPVGGSKAVWFIRHGYDPSSPDALIDDLLAIARSCDDFVEQPFAFGIKYIAVGEATSPTGVTCEILTVWKIETGTMIPQFVTAYPA